MIQRAEVKIGMRFLEITRLQDFGNLSPGGYIQTAKRRKFSRKMDEFVRLKFFCLQNSPKTNIFFIFCKDFLRFAVFTLLPGFQPFGALWVCIPCLWGPFRVCPTLGLVELLDMKCELLDKGIRNKSTLCKYTKL